MQKLKKEMILNMLKDKGGKDIDMKMLFRDKCKEIIKKQCNEGVIGIEYDNKIAKIYNSSIKDGERKINIKDRYYPENIK